MIALPVADEINRLHALATDHAGKAIDYAKQAGRLLLDVKAGLPHGAFLPWLADNVAVSERQAQRYMRAALGKPVSTRALAAPKSDTVSYFPSWLPKDGMAAILETHMGDAYIQERADAPGYFRYAVVLDDADGGATLEYSRRSIRGDYVERALSMHMPSIRAAKPDDWVRADISLGDLFGIPEWKTEGCHA